MGEIILQIGCNNCEDSVKEFVLKNQEKIDNFIVVDALPKSIDCAKKVYSELGPKLIPIICAVGVKNGVIPFYFPESEEGSVHASASLEHVFQHRHEKVNVFYSPVVDINNLFESLGLTRISRLYIDMEGWDVDALLHLDFSGLEIPFIEYEFTHSDGTFSVGEKHQTLVNKLSSLGYSLIRSGEYNILATKND